VSNNKEHNDPVTSDSAAKAAEASTDDQEQIVTTETVTDNKSKQGGSLPTLIAVIALLIALAAAGGAGWLWQQLQQSKHALSQTISEQSQSSQSKSNQLQSDINLLGEHLSSVSSELDSKLSAQNDDLTALASEIKTAASNTEHVAETITALHSKLNINPKTGWLIAEAEYLLSIANQQLQLVGNVESSIVALRSADQRLRESGDPSVLDVRSIIADEITQLKSVHVTDIAGAALTLASMQARVDDLSLAGQNHAPTKTATKELDSTKEDKANEGWRGALDTAWHAVKDLVVIRERGDSDANEPLLTPDQRALIYQNLRLKLESARLSLIQGDATTYRQSLDITHDWLLEYFDDNAKRTAVNETIDELGRIKLSEKMPDISASLKALRTWQHQQNNTAE